VLRHQFPGGIDRLAANIGTCFEDQRDADSLTITPSSQSEDTSVRQEE